MAKGQSEGASQDAPAVFPAWAHTVAEVAKELNVDVHAGLTEEEASKRLKQYGTNELEKEPPTPVWKLVLEQFDDMVRPVLAYQTAFPRSGAHTFQSANATPSVQQNSTATAMLCSGLSSH